MSSRWALLLTAAFVLAAGGSALAVEAQPGEVEARFNARFSPQRFSPSKWTPLSPRVSMRFWSSDGTRPPALEEFEIEEDRRLRLNLKEVPVCRPANVDEPPTKQRCKDALIGSGKMETNILFPESIPIPIQSEVTAYNAGLRNGVRTLLLDAFLVVPSPRDIVMTVEVKHSDLGRYGVKLVGSVPEIAGGSGSIIDLSLGLHKNIFSATCSIGHLNTGFATTFVDGIHLLGRVTRPCTPVP